MKNWLNNKNWDSRKWISNQTKKEIKIQSFIEIEDSDSKKPLASMILIMSPISLIILMLPITQLKPIKINQLPKIRSIRI
jgi:hypothetical protein